MNERDERTRVAGATNCSSVRTRHLALGVVLAVAALMLVHIESGLHASYAPEVVLVQPPHDPEASDERASCVADIFTEERTVREKPLRALESIYDAIDPNVFYATNENGYHLLETGLLRYQGEFEIEIRCDVPGDDGFSYMVINNENNRCSIAEGGTVLLC